MNPRLKIFCGLLLIHALALGAATIQSVVFQLDGKSIRWADVILFGGFLGGLTALFLVATFAIWRGKQILARVIGIGLGLFGLGELILGLMMTVMGAIGPADPYILPLGLIGVFVGLVHLTMTFLGWTGTPLNLH